MRTMVAALAVSVFATGLAFGQYKSQPPAAQTPAQPAAQMPTQPAAPAVKMATVQPQPEASLDSARRITREEAMKMVKEGKAIYVDVRSKEQYDISHIKGAVSVPLSEIMTRLRELPPNKFWVTYCA